MPDHVSSSSSPKNEIQKNMLVLQNYAKKVIVQSRKVQQGAVTQHIIIITPIQNVCEVGMQYHYTDLSPDINCEKIVTFR